MNGSKRRGRSYDLNSGVAMVDLPKCHGNIEIILKIGKIWEYHDVSSEKYTYEQGNIIKVLGIYRNIMGI